MQHDVSFIYCEVATRIFIKMKQLYVDWLQPWWLPKPDMFCTLTQEDHLIVWWYGYRLRCVTLFSTRWQTGKCVWPIFHLKDVTFLQAACKIFMQRVSAAINSQLNTKPLFLPRALCHPQTQRYKFIQLHWQTRCTLHSDCIEHKNTPYNLLFLCLAWLAISVWDVLLTAK